MVSMAQFDLQGWVSSPVRVDSGTQNEVVSVLDSVLARHLLQRRIAPGDWKNEEMSLHIFCDESKLAYAACALLRKVNGGEVFHASAAETAFALLPKDRVALTAVFEVYSVYSCRLCWTAVFEICKEEIINSKILKIIVKFDEYDAVFCGWLQDGILELVPSATKNDGHYLPHRPNISEARSTGTELRKFMKEATEMVSMAQFDLQGWVSSPVRVDSGTQNEVVSVLGLLWDITTDELTCEINTIALTTCPEVCKCKLELDEAVPDCIESKFKIWVKQIQWLARHLLQRRIAPGDWKNEEMSLHIFCDENYAGLLYLKSGEKAWVVLFTCAVYHAVHLELVVSNTRRLHPSSEMISCKDDNGTHFVGLNNFLTTLNWEEIVAPSTVKRIMWKFIPPRQPGEAVGRRD
ncbi:hypothetical protein PR048_025268 [Dryococelus australis]|uniref:Uncharacterized protein n=1 Tax=Dryococelus australis TaxID=614101 RepID=A0ABQ9GQY5_9NEOP|nr:hypothetical protein PR048_025268 [Dryococelus australis]